MEGWHGIDKKRFTVDPEQAGGHLEWKQHPDKTAYEMEQLDGDCLTGKSWTSASLAPMR